MTPKHVTSTTGAQAMEGRRMNRGNG
jgi:hypothetical protein